MYQNPSLFPAITNRESWSPQFTLYDDETGDLLDLTNLTFQLEVRNLRRRDYDASGYGPSYGYGTADYQTPILTASLGNGITVTGPGTFEVFFSETQMSTLSPDTYSVACTVNDGTNVRQLFLGRLPVLDGMVTT